MQNKPRMKKPALFSGFTALLLGLLIPIGTLAAQENEQIAKIHIDADERVFLIDGLLWGSNVLNEAPRDQTVDDPRFIKASQQMGVRIIRWPGGNNADIYDWKRNEIVKPGRRLPLENGVTLPEIVKFCRKIGAELSITINFGTMSPQDAADLVEYCNGPADSKWGRVRAGHGFTEPLNIRYFEIGNEENQSHMWLYSWTAENPRKYFFGGDEERRGNYPGSIHDAVGKKGDVFMAAGGPNQVYPMRFPPIKNVRVFWAASKTDAENGIYEEWRQVDDLQQEPADARVFAIDSTAGTVHFGDDVYGFAPPRGSWFLVEYTTYGRKGFIDFVRAMRAAPSSVPIKIAAASLPFKNKQPAVSPDSLVLIFEAMDFSIAHQYSSAYPFATYADRRIFASERTQNLQVRLLQSVLDTLGVNKTIGVAATEWNIFLDTDFWYIDRNLEGGVIAAEYFIRVLNAMPELRVWFAQQFALHGGALALVRTQGNYSIAPMGYVFEGFKPWAGAWRVPVQTDSPAKDANDAPLPFINAAAAVSASGDTLFLAMSNSAEEESVVCATTVQGFEYRSARIRRLEGASIASHNDVDPANVVLRDEIVAAGEADSLLLQPHSVVFVEFYGETSTVVDGGIEPVDFELEQNYPNPFNPQTTIHYRLAAIGKVELTVYDVAGRRVRTLIRSVQPAGTFDVAWDGRDDRGDTVASGVYLYRLAAGQRSQTRSMLFLR